jgi:hypothetical protein
MVYAKHSLTKIDLSAVLLAATSAPGCAQTIDPTATTAAPCELAIPRKTISDWADFSWHEEDNAALEPPTTDRKRVASIGSLSIGQSGRQFDPSFFPQKPCINRGISGDDSTDAAEVRTRCEGVEAWRSCLPRRYQRCCRKYRTDTARNDLGEHPCNGRDRSGQQN